MSPLPSTTLSTVKIDINEYLTLIDTPGLVDSESLVNYINEDELRKLVLEKRLN